MINYSKILRYFKKGIRDPKRAWRLIRDNGLLVFFNNCIDLPICRRFLRSPIEKILDSVDKKNIVILTTQHCFFVGKLIQDKLLKVGITSEIIYKRPKGGYSNKLHIVICPQMFPILPKVYVSYQMEQSISNRWFNEKYCRILKNSIAICDYASPNIEYLQKAGISYKKIFYLPIFTKKVNPEIGNYEYDVIFYGDVKNSRRQEILSKLTKKFKVKIINNLFGQELYAEIKKARIVLNIHYYNNALLESTRVFEALSLGKIVVSEKSSDIYDYKFLRNIVEFVSEDCYEELECKITKWISYSDNEFNRKLLDKLEILEKQFDIFEFYFYRVLLNFDLISYDQFYYTIGEKLILPSANICLSLNETIDRQSYFKKIDPLSCYIFSGLRHHNGWVGCGLSYKFLLMRAKAQGYKNVLICEDDVKFGDSFQINFKKVREYLTVNTNWDIFAGLMADLPDDVRILKIDKKDTIKLICIDRVVSTVFSLYNESVYNIIIRWDYMDRDRESNTIDRYLQRYSGLRIITTLPFLVGHNEIQQSTLWDQGNDIYTLMIENTQHKLWNKISDAN